MKDYFPQAEKMMGQLKLFADQYNLPVNKLTMIPNTNKMLRIAEYAKEVNKAEKLNERIFKAVFVEDRNISLMTEIIDLCGQVGISKEEVDHVLASEKYRVQLDNHKKFCHTNKITSVPTFIINDQVAIVGAQGPENFKAAFKNLLDKI